MDQSSGEEIRHWLTLLRSLAWAYLPLFLLLWARLLLILLEAMIGPRREVQQRLVHPLPTSTTHERDSHEEPDVQASLKKENASTRSYRALCA